MLSRAIPFLAILLGGCDSALPPGAAQDETSAAHAPQPLPTPRPLPQMLAALPLDHCSDTADGFDRWLISVRREAVAKGVKEGTLRAAFDAITYDPSVIALDRAQKPFKTTFAKFAARRVTTPRVARGKRVLADNRALLARITERFGVQPELLVAIWGLETDYGEYAGSTSSLKALATLAYDCRRAPRFRGELLAALRILDRDDLTLDEFVGAWAGELGQTQFLPSSYVEFGVDFDGDGHVDMVSSSADALASTAHYLSGHGWQARAPYEPGTPNFEALRTWNESEMYCKTLVLFASKLVPR